MARMTGARFWYYDEVNDGFDVSSFEESSSIVAREIITRSGLPLSGGAYTQTSVMTKEKVVSRIIDDTP